MGEDTTAATSFDGGSVKGVLARVTDAVLAVDEEFRITYFNAQAERIFDQSEGEICEEVVWELFPEAVGSTIREECEHAMEAQTSVTLEEFHPALETWFEVRIYPSETGVSVYFRDITERLEREHELQARESTLRRIYEILGDSDRPFTDQIDDLLQIVREVVGTEYATLSEINGDEYVFRAVDTPDGADIQAGDTASLEVTNCERVAETNQTLVLNDVEADAPELADRAGNAEWGISCYLGAPVTVNGDVYGTFCFYGMEPRSEAFSDWEVTVVDLLSSWVSKELERQHHLNQLTVLSELNAAVRKITGAIVEQSPREEIESIICRSLAAADPYSFAWVGSIDQSQGHVTLRAEAGVNDYLDDIEVLYRDTENSSTPAEQAIKTGNVQVARNLQSNTEYPAWHEQAEKNSFNSWMAIPISYDGSLYGVLNVYSARSDAFVEQERAVLTQLGELAGHAFTAAQRRDALMSDDIVEVEFEVQDVFDSLNVSSSVAETIVFDRTVSIGDGRFLIYGWASETDVEALHAICDGVPSWGSPEIISEGDDRMRFIIRLSEPPIFSEVASQGGRIESARIENGDYRMTVHLPNSAEISLINNIIQETYPNAELIAQRQTVQPDESEARLYPAALDDLTQRQRTALETAFYAGFFEWPRDVTGEEIAESMGISPATYHEHLRAGQQKILQKLLGQEG